MYILSIMSLTKKQQQALDEFRKAGGVLRTSAALDLGIHPRTLYQLRDQGFLERISRGVYRLAELPPLRDPDLVRVATRVPRAVVCLISALHFHRMTSQVPHTVSIALPQGVKTPELALPPIRVFRFSDKSYRAGVEEHPVDEVPVRVYGPAKTVADCFKFRHKIGLEVALEGLRTGLEEDRFAPAELMEFARTCRVHKIIGPYLAAML
jgi:predicted transcriptional regulator of viral defense system